MTVSMRRRAALYALTKLCDLALAVIAALSIWVLIGALFGLD